MILKDLELERRDEVDALKIKSSWVSNHETYWKIACSLSKHCIMENGTDPNELEPNKSQSEQVDGKPNTENGDLEYTEDEVEFADGKGTLLDDEIDEDDDEEVKE
jgi:hypothetical protein